MFFKIYIKATCRFFNSVLERGIPRRGEQCPVVIISYMGYSPPKCSCNGTSQHPHSYNSQCIDGMIYIMHENVFHAYTSSHPPTPSHVPMLSVKIVIGNANDTQLPSPCRLTNTQCNLPMDSNPSRVNPDSYHSTLGLSDEHDRVFSLRQQHFLDFTASL